MKWVSENSGKPGLEFVCTCQKWTQPQKGSSSDRSSGHSFVVRLTANGQHGHAGTDVDHQEWVRIAQVEKVFFVLVFVMFSGAFGLAIFTRFLTWQVKTFVLLVDGLNVLNATDQRLEFIKLVQNQIHFSSEQLFKLVRTAARRTDCRKRMKKLCYRTDGLIWLPFFVSSTCGGQTGDSFRFGQFNEFVHFRSWKANEMQSSSSSVHRTARQL